MTPAIHSILLSSLLVLTNSATASDWPQFHGPTSTGHSSESINPKGPFKTLWKANVGTGFSSVTIASLETRVLGRGKVTRVQKPFAFTLGHNGRSGSNGKESIYCLDGDTGAIVWQHSYDAPLIDRFYEGGPGASVTVRNGKAYAYSKHGHLFCLDAAKGKMIWKQNMPKLAKIKVPEWGFACSPTFLDESTLLIEAGATFALNPETGKIKWQSKAYQPAYGSPAIFALEGKTYIASLKSSGLVILDAKDGATIDTAEWRTSFDTNATTPIIKGNQIFISTGYQRGCALFELKNGKLTKRYENQSMSNHMNQSMLIDGHLYGFDGTAHRGPKSSFACIDFSTGAEKWRMSARSGFGCGSLIATADKHLILFSERGELVTLKATPDAAKILHRQQILGGRCWTPPSLAHGKIYLRNAKGDVACVEVQE